VSQKTKGKFNMNKINTRTPSINWQLVEKSATIHAISSQVLLGGNSILADKLLLNTLEGNQQIGKSMICLGATGDIWQQAPRKLLEKYTVTAITDDGWLECTSIPGVLSDVFEVPDQENGNQDVYILAQWGQNSPEGKIQMGKVGDFILRDPNNHDDVWIVAQKFFLNTYKFI
jgi:hypothetical protein